MCWNATHGMGRIIPAHFTSRVPGLELARGPLSPNRWKRAERRRGEEEERHGKRWMETGRVKKKRVSLFSLTLGIEGVADLTMRQQPWMVPLSFRLTLLPSVQWTCHKACVQCIHYPILHVPIWHVNMPYSWALNLFTICFPIVVSLMLPALKW